LEAIWHRLLGFAHIFRRNGLGMAGLVILLVFAGMAISAPLLTSSGLLRDPKASLCGVDYHVCRTTDSQLARYQGPNGLVWLGTDHLGRDIFSRIWWGTQFTVVIGFLASVVSMGLGTFVGMIAGYYGGWVDEALMRLTDFFLVLPTLVLALVLAGIFARSGGGGGSVLTIIAVIGVSLWSSTSRLVRSQVLSLKQRQFIERARAVGAGSTRIVWRHIFPNAFSLVFAEAILTIAVAILTESFLSYLHLGPSDVTTWGTIIDEANSHNVMTLRLYWWIFAPGFAIVILVLGFTLLGYALDEIFNPRLRKR
ncbi:MAG TPA: ABC transporter permease, partial [Thermoplasmata archaeon]|nr:ABC transporter permease [Thermoplasmata archaeon]